MTCIIGSSKDGVVYIGGDSAGVGKLDITIRDDVKVFKNKDMVFGFTSSFRMGQILHHCLTIPDMTDETSDYQYMVKTFIPEVIKTFNQQDYSKSEHGQVTGGSFLVGFRGTLYAIDSDFQVGIPADKFDSIGCGSELAKGAMAALKDLDPKERIIKSLEISTYYNGGVRPPFRIEVLGEETNKPNILERENYGI